MGSNLLELLRKDVAGFNAYRQKYPCIEIEFRGVNLEGANLKGTKFTDADIAKAIF